MFKHSKIIVLFFTIALLLSVKANDEGENCAAVSCIRVLKEDCTPLGGRYFDANIKNGICCAWCQVDCERWWSTCPRVNEDDCLQRGGNFIPAMPTAARCCAQCIIEENPGTSDL